MNKNETPSDNPFDNWSEAALNVLLQAMADSKADIAAGRYVIESPEEHMARLEAMLKDKA